MLYQVVLLQTVGVGQRRSQQQSTAALRTRTPQEPGEPGRNLVKVAMLRPALHNGRFVVPSPGSCLLVHHSTSRPSLLRRTPASSASAADGYGAADGSAAAGKGAHGKHEAPAAPSHALQASPTTTPSPLQRNNHWWIFACTCLAFVVVAWFTSISPLLTATKPLVEAGTDVLQAAQPHIGDASATVAAIKPALEAIAATKPLVQSIMPYGLSLGVCVPLGCEFANATGMATGIGGALGTVAGFILGKLLMRLGLP